MINARNLRCNYEDKKLCPFICLILVLTGCGQAVENDTGAETGDISSGALRKEVFALVSSAENSTTDYAEQYAYIEDIGDGRGYAAGTIGFTSGTGDLLEVVKRCTEQRVYPDFDKLVEKAVMVTEDEDAGLAYYQYYFGDKAATSRGNGNLSKYGSCDSLLIGDGSAIGAYIQDLAITKSELYLPESFEWKLLNNGMFASDETVRELMEHPEYADAVWQVKTE